MTPSPRPATVAVTARRTLAAASLAIVVAALTACTADADAFPPEQPAASGTPTVPSDEQSPEPTPTGSREPAELTTSERLERAMTSGNTADIEELLTEPTRVVIAASEADMQYGTVDAVLSLDYVRPGVGTWEFALDDALLDTFAANPYYGEFFPDNAVVGVSDASAVVSFVPNGARIGTIFMAIDEALLTDY